MLSIIVAIFSFIWAIIEAISVIGVVAIAALLLFAYATKPTNESFKKFLKHELNKFTKSRVLTFITVKVFDKDIKDYVFFKIATINNPYDDQRGRDTITFLGLFQTWSRVN
jgi:hypothetical protein